MAKHGGRFGEISSAEIQIILDNTTSKAADKSIKYSIKLFNEWLASPSGAKFSKPMEEMSKEELNTCLKYFYLSARKQDGSYYKGASLMSIRASIDRYLRSPPHSKQFSIVSDAAFTEANKMLVAFVKHLKRSGKIEGVVHRQAITSEQVQKLYESGQLGPANSQDPAQLQRTVWFCLGLFFGRRGRENQQELKCRMLVLRKTPRGVEYFELDRQMPSSLPSARSATDVQDESDVKAMFSVVGSPRCPVQTIKNYLAHLNPVSDALFQRPIAKFRPKDTIWYGPWPLGQNKLGTFMREMSKKAGIEPHITNHCLKVTAVSVLSHRNYATSHTVKEEAASTTTDQTIKFHCQQSSFEHEQHTSSFQRNVFAPMAEPKVIATVIEIEQKQNSGGEIAFQVRKIPIVAASSSTSNINVSQGGQINPLQLFLH